MGPRSTCSILVACSAGLCSGGCDDPHVPHVAFEREGEDLEIVVATPGCSVDAPGLLWPIDCAPGESCATGIGEPDLDGDGVGFHCEPAAYSNHRGTDLGVTEAAMFAGVAVLAVAAGEVVYVRDDRHDRCDVDTDHPDCVDPPAGWSQPGGANGNKVCTHSSSAFCDPGSDQSSCSLCFQGGNVIVIRHVDSPAVFASYYAHLRKGSVRVEVGEMVGAGHPIAMVGSSGHSSGPHLHFEPWAGWKRPMDPWSGPCSRRGDEAYLFASDPPWCVGGGRIE